MITMTLAAYIAANTATCGATGYRFKPVFHYLPESGGRWAGEAGAVKVWNGEPYVQLDKPRFYGIPFGPESATCLKWIPLRLLRGSDGEIFEVE